MKLKRAVDIVVGLILATLAAPIVLICAVGCAVSLRTWPFFVQHRLGRDGKPFPLPKLRTLPRTVPRAIDKYQLAGLRIPAFCRLLRRTHLDELPQLLVVPLGWMSLVGPRPEMPDMIARYPRNFAAARAQVRPGCTGLWQISTASGKLIYESPEYDLVYAHSRGLRLDVWILYRTLRMLATGRAAIDLGDVPHWALKRGLVALTPTATSTEVAADGAEGAIVIDLREHAAVGIEVRGDDTENATIIDLGEPDAAFGEISASNLTE